MSNKKHEEGLAKQIRPMIKIPDWGRYKLSNGVIIEADTNASIDDLTMGAFEAGADEVELAKIIRHLIGLVEHRRGFRIKKPTKQTMDSYLDNLLIKGESR